MWPPVGVQQQWYPLIRRHDVAVPPHPTALQTGARAAVCLKAFIVLVRLRCVKAVVEDDGSCDAQLRPARCTEAEEATVAFCSTAARAGRSREGMSCSQAQPLARLLQEDARRQAALLFTALRLVGAVLL